MVFELVLFGSENVDAIPAMARLYVNRDEEKAYFINGLKAKELAEEGEIKVTFMNTNDWRGWAEDEGLEIDETDIGPKLRKKAKEIDKADVESEKRKKDEQPSKKRAR